MATNTKERNALRAQLVTDFMAFLNERGEDAMLGASNKIVFPVVGADGGEYFATVTIAIPTGGRDGEPFDGYALAEEYAIKCKNKEDKKKEKSSK